MTNNEIIDTINMLIDAVNDIESVDKKSLILQAESAIERITIPANIIENKNPDWEDISLELPVDDFPYLLSDGINLAIKSTGVPLDNNLNPLDFDDNLRDITLSDNQVKAFLSISIGRILSEEIARRKSGEKSDSDNLMDGSNYENLK